MELEVKFYVPFPVEMPVDFCLPLHYQRHNETGMQDASHENNYQPLVGEHHRFESSCQSFHNGQHTE